MNELSISQFELVYNSLSFGIAGMGAVTLFLWLSRDMVAPAYRTAVTISGLVTFIACYHYSRMLGSWNDAYSVVNGTLASTGSKFNDAYRYVDWLLTVPLLLIELILVMRLTRSETMSKSIRLGSLAALMILLGYPGEISADSNTRWIFWTLSMIPFSIIVFELFVGLKQSIASQPANVKGLVNGARFMTVASWCFYPIVFVLPMVGLSGGDATAAVQVGYTIADLVAKAAFGILIFSIASRKSEAEGTGEPSLTTA
ncbi:MAG: bacteriorhodopsin-like [Fimbriimonas sp.]